MGLIEGNDTGSAEEIIYYIMLLEGILDLLTEKGVLNGAESKQCIVEKLRAATKLNLRLAN